MYKPEVTQIFFVSKFTASSSNSWLFSVLSFTSLHCFPTYPVCAWPFQSQHLLTALVFFCQLGLCLFSVCAHSLSFLFPFSSFLPFSFLFSFSLSIFLSFFLSLIIILVSRCLTFYNTEWQGWIGRHLVCHSLQTTETLMLPTHICSTLCKTHGKSSIVLSFAFCSCFTSYVPKSIASCWLIPWYDYLGHSADATLPKKKKRKKKNYIVKVVLQTLRTSISYFLGFTFYFYGFQLFSCFTLHTDSFIQQSDSWITYGYMIFHGFFYGG